MFVTCHKYFAFNFSKTIPLEIYFLLENLLFGSEALKWQLKWSNIFFLKNVIEGGATAAENCWVAIFSTCACFLV